MQEKDIRGQGPWDRASMSLRTFNQRLVPFIYGDFGTASQPCKVRPYLGLWLTGAWKTTGLKKTAVCKTNCNSSFFTVLGGTEMEPIRKCQICCFCT